MLILIWLLNVNNQFEKKFQIHIEPSNETEIIYFSSEVHFTLLTLKE